MFRRTIFLLLLPLAGLGISVPVKDARPGFGYAGRLEPYPASTDWMPRPMSQPVQRGVVIAWKSSSPNLFAESSASCRD